MREREKGRNEREWGRGGASKEGERKEIGKMGVVGERERGEEVKGGLKWV